MRRIKVILAALALVGASFAAFSGPAMADNLNCHDASGNLVRCDGQLFAPIDQVNGVNDFSNNGLNDFSNFDFCNEIGGICFPFGFPFGFGLNNFDNSNGLNGFDLNNFDNSNGFDGSQFGA